MLLKKLLDIVQNKVIRYINLYNKKLFTKLHLLM